MNRLEIFFKDIPSIVFEPVAVFGWLGLITALIIYRKQRGVFYWTVIAALCFMIAWRVAIGIITSRYAEILIFPMIGAAAYFIFQLKHLRKIFPRLPEKYCRYIPAGILIILTLVCIGKNLNFNSYNPVMNAAGTVAKDDKSEKSVIYTNEYDRAYQIMYYSGLKVKFIRKYDAGDQNALWCREVVAEAKKEAYQNVYIFISSPSKIPAFTAAEVGAEPAQWSLFTEEYFNRKKKKVLRVYRYTGGILQ